MERLYFSPTNSAPEILFSLEENIFSITGTSRPEDVRSLYYPVIDWLKRLVDNMMKGNHYNFSSENPFKLKIDLSYFNSSSAKFLFDIFSELKLISASDIPVVVEWYYDNDDPELKEAGEDISSMAGMKFKYIGKEVDEE
jgi:hypothetical protein